MPQRSERPNQTNVSKVVVAVEKGVLHVVSVMASFSKVFCDLSIGYPLLLSRQFFSFSSRKPFSGEAKRARQKFLRISLSVKAIIVSPTFCSAAMAFNWYL